MTVLLNTFKGYLDTFTLLDLFFSPLEVGNEPSVFCISYTYSPSKKLFSCAKFTIAANNPQCTKSEPVSVNGMEIFSIKFTLDS